MSSRLLITGASGFVGRHVMAALSGGGARPDMDVLLLTHRPTADDTPKSMRWVHGDLFDNASIEALLNRFAPTHLMHLAWVTTPGSYLTTPDNFRWLAASIGLLTQFARSGGKHAVIAGSSFEYCATATECIEGQTADQPESLYARTKHALYRLLPDIADATSLKWAWARIFQVYGPGEPAEKLITAAIRQCLRRELVLCRSPHVVRDFVHVTDVAQGLLELSRLEAQGLYNLATGEGVAIKDVLGTIADEAAQGEVRCDEEGAGGPSRLVGNISKAKRNLGWSPKTWLREGLRSMIEAERESLPAVDA